MSAVRVQNDAAGAGSDLRDEERWSRAGDGHPGGEDRIALHGVTEDGNREIGQKTVSRLTDDEQSESQPSE